MASSAGAWSGRRYDVGEGILQNVLGECRIPNTALQVARECAVIFKQRRKRCTVLGSIHLSIVRAGLKSGRPQEPRRLPCGSSSWVPCDGV